MADRTAPRTRGVFAGAVLAVGITCAAWQAPHVGAAAVVVDPEQAAERAAGELLALGEDGGVLNVYWDADAKQIVVLTPADALEPDVSSVDLKEVSVRLEPTAIYRGDLAAVKLAIASRLSAGKINPAPWGIYVDPRTATIVVQGPDEVPLEDLLQAYPGRIEFRKRDGEAFLADRNHDVPPFYGGSRFVGSGHGCTLGFAIHLQGGAAAMLSAGHCWPVGTSPSNSAGQHAGSVISRENPRSSQPSHDTEFLTGKTYSAHIYVGQDNNQTKTVVGAGNAAVGFAYCYSGGTTYEHCAVASSVGISQFFPNDQVWVDDLVETSPGFVMSGDSGAPFYRMVGSTDVSARGTVVGHLTDTSGHTVDYFQSWGYISSRWAASICVDVYTC